MEDKITLDRRAFKVLASDTRIDILKYLNARRMTLTELSKRLGMSASSVKEHMENLSSAGLVVQMDEGHKWKYYELTGRGRDIVNPVDKKVFFILGLSVLVMLAGLYSIFSRLFYQPVLGAAEGAKDAIRAPLASGGGAMPAPALQAFPLVEVVAVIASVLVTGLGLGYLVARRRAGRYLL